MCLLRLVLVDLGGVTFRWNILSSVLGTDSVKGDRSVGSRVVSG